MSLEESLNHTLGVHVPVDESTRTSSTDLGGSVQGQVDAGVDRRGG